MSFARPAILLALAVLPLLVAWYLLAQRARRRAVESFAAPRMAPSFAPHRPGWRRHAPLAVFLVALGVLVVAAARPRATRAVPVGRLSIMLATDVSGSMRATDVAPNRVTAAQRAADAFVNGIPGSVSVGVMEFNQNPVVLQQPTHDHLALFAALGHLQTGGGTAIGTALQTALGVLSRTRAPAGRGPSSAIVLLSDGYSTSGPDPQAAARQAGRLHVPIFTVALGTPGGTITVTEPRTGRTVTHRVPPDPQALGQLAKLSGGQAYTAADASRLSRVYRRLGSQLGHTRQRREITADVAGGGLALLLLGSVLSLAWFGRLI